MKLRNKKTGEIRGVKDLRVYIGEQEYISMLDANTDWEEFKPKEPLIKDKKVRETVRAWVKANEMKPSDTVDYSSLYYKFEGSYCSIDFNAPVGSLESGIYTIAELCGEEE